MLVCFVSHAIHTWQRNLALSLVYPHNILMSQPGEFANSENGVQCSMCQTRRPIPEMVVDATVTVACYCLLLLFL